MAAVLRGLPKRAGRAQAFTRIMKIPFLLGQIRNRRWSTWWLAAVLVLAGGPARAAVEQVIVVFKTHFDIGYTDMATNVVQRYRTTMIDDALEVVDQNRDLPVEQQFVWTLAGWPLAKILEDWPGQKPDRQRRVRDAFRQGHFVTHALPFTTHTELLESEDLVRGLGYASRLSREAGLPLPRDAKMTDVPSHSWIMPTLLRHAGVDFLHLGCNAASRSPRVPVLFWWEGPDGSRLLTMYTAESYGTGLIPPANWPHRTWLALIHTGDNHGPPRPNEVKSVLDEAKAKLPGVKVRIGRLSDFADAILAEAGRPDDRVVPTPTPADPTAQTPGTRASGGPTIPVVRGDMPDTWIHGPMSDPQGGSLARTIRPRIAMAESLNTLLPLWGVKPAPAADTVARAYENSLLYGEHTWGGAYWWIYGKYLAHYGEAWRAERKAGRFDRIESSWAEHTAYIETAARLTQPLLESQMKALAEAVAQDGDRVVIFNPLPWRRVRGVAFADLGNTGFKEAGPGVLTASDDGIGGFYDLRGTQLRCLPGGLPALGYVTLTNEPAVVNSMHLPALDRGNAALGSGYLSARLDLARGTLASLSAAPVHVGSTVLAEVPECVDRSSPFGFGQVLYERFDSNHVAAFVRDYVKISADWATNELGKPDLPPASVAPYAAASPREFVADYHRSFFSAEAALRAPASERVPFGVTTRYVFYNHRRFFDIEVTIENKPADPWPEAAWLCLPFEVASPRFRLGRLGSIIDPAQDIVPGANRHLLAVDTGLAVVDPSGRGFGVCPIDSPLVSLGEPGCWKYSMDFVPGKATIFIHLFNNQWTTNFRLWNEGTWTARVRVWPIDAYDPVESLIRPSLEARFPLQAVCVSGKGGTLAKTATGLSVDPKPYPWPLDPLLPVDPTPRTGGGHRNVLVTAFGPNPDGPGTLLRLWEMAGQAGDCPVSLPSGLNVTQAQPVDLRGRPLGAALTVTNGSFTVPLKAYAPASYLLGTN